VKIELSAQYDPKLVEGEIYAKWLAAGVFHAVPDGRSQRFSVVIPPPNVTGALHLGHAINGTIQDILVRYHRMKGDNTLWMPGIDHAGIATQAVVEKTIFEKEKKSRHDLGREELVRRIWEWKEQFGNRILNQQAQLGASCDWERTRFTLDDICARAVREAFFKMFKDGLIFRGKRLVNWDTHLQTAVADDEIYHETVKGQMTSIRYPVEGAEGEYLVVATTRPETMLGDTAVAVHPDDSRYQHLIGKRVIVPLVGRPIPVIADGLLVDPKFGTGVVKVTPAHDPNDYATGVRHNLEQINLLTADGKMNEHGAGTFQGKNYSYVSMKFATVARKQILADLETLGLIVEVKLHEHEVGHSDRSKTPIEPYLSDQWFVRMGDVTNAAREIESTAAEGITLADGKRVSGLAQAAMDAVSDGRVRITPERYAKGYLDWLGKKRDWCISRQLWWGHRIPVWSARDFVQLTDDFKFKIEKWKEEGRLSASHHSATTSFETTANLPKQEYFCIRSEDKEIEKYLAELGYEQDPDVLDTWFSSALWPISTMGWPATGTSQKPEDQLLPYYYPTSVLSTARDILTLWVARMVMFGLYCHGQIPFRQVYIHAVIQDGEGRTMSKSKGNGVDPVDIVQSHGADALRFTLAALSTETQDVRMPVVKDPKTGTNTSPKFDVGRNFANKIWNACRFILSNVQADTQLTNLQPHSAALEDRWIISRLNRTIDAVTEGINGFHFADVAESLRSFFWGDLCDWYLEIAKGRIRAGDAAVQGVLLLCIRTSLQLLHPVMPFVTEAIWEKLPGNEGTMLVTSSFPIFNSTQIDPAAEQQIAAVQGVTSAIREIQNRYPAAKGKVLEVTVQTRTAELATVILEGRGIIEPLAGVTLLEVSPNATKPKDAATAVIGDAQIFIAGVVDKDAESAKLKKRREELTKFIAGNHAKLSNEAFVGKAPAQVVQGLRDQLAKLQEEMAAIDANLAELNA